MKKIIAIALLAACTAGTTFAQDSKMNNGSKKEMRAEKKASKGKMKKGGKKMDKMDKKGDNNANGNM